MELRLAEKVTCSHNGCVITELGIGNFKAFGDTQRVPIKPLTLIFGANSSGKSSIIHALLLAHHAMETGEYDVHQTKLAGDMVDLGGFRNYVHKHDSSKTVSLRFETDIDCEALGRHLDGDAKGKAPFLKLSRFGLSLTVAGGDGLSAEMQRRGRPTAPLKALRQEAVIERIEILVDGEAALTFSRWTPDFKERAALLELIGEAGQTFPRSIAFFPCFQAQTPSGVGSFLGQIIRCLAESSRADGAPDDSASSSAYYDVPRGEQTTSVLALEETAEGNQPPPASAGPSLESGFARLQQAFAEAITERCFRFDGFVLRDDGYLDAVASEEDRPWRAQARVLCHKLAGLIEFGTAKIAAGLRGISYLSPLRCVPPRDFAAQGAQEPQMPAGGGWAWEVLCREPAVAESVNRWLGANGLTTQYRLKLRPLLDAERVRRAHEEGADAARLLFDYAERTELRFEDLQSETVLTHRDIGFGIGQVLPVLVGASALRGSLIAIEQPELHLHPAQQAELSDVFIESALGERKNTFLLETHSEHLILRIMRRIRETHAGTLPKGKTPVTKKDVSILFVERDGARCLVREMPLNERGELVKAWPGGFFEEGFNEMF